MNNTIQEARGTLASCVKAVCHLKRCVPLDLECKADTVKCNVALLPKFNQETLDIRILAFSEHWVFELAEYLVWSWPPLAMRRTASSRLPSSAALMTARATLSSNKDLPHGAEGPKARLTCQQARQRTKRDCCQCLHLALLPMGTSRESSKTLAHAPGKAESLSTAEDIAAHPCTEGDKSCPPRSSKKKATSWLSCSARMTQASEWRALGLY